jgi:dihydrofolate reductase
MSRKPKHKETRIKVSAYIATSLDGFIARENGALDWLPGSAGASDGEDYGYHEFMETVDVLLMGCKTYEQVRSFGQWPYGEKRVMVWSRYAVQIPANLSKTVEYRSSTPEKMVDELAKAGVQHLYVDGGKTIQSFIQAGLMQQIIITTVPILIGKGIRLFGNIDQDIHLRHSKTISFDNGFVQSWYDVLA